MSHRRRCPMFRTVSVVLVGAALGAALWFAPPTYGKGQVPPPSSMAGRAVAERSAGSQGNGLVPISVANRSQLSVIEGVAGGSPFAGNYEAEVPGSCCGWDVNISRSGKV